MHTSTELCHRRVGPVSDGGGSFRRRVGGGPWFRGSERCHFYHLLPGGPAPLSHLGLRSLGARPPCHRDLASSPDPIGGAGGGRRRRQICPGCGIPLVMRSPRKQARAPPRLSVLSSDGVSQEARRREAVHVRGVPVPLRRRRRRVVSFAVPRRPGDPGLLRLP